MKVKEKQMKVKRLNITESEYVLNQCKDVFRHGFKALANKHGIKISEFMNMLDATFNVNDYKNKNEEEFLNTLMLKVVNPVFEDNGIKLVD
tara:strand:- start:28 stop:300 length:273 start_codon:yes stop_codon:yes gene_type:complete